MRSVWLSLLHFLLFFFSVMLVVFPLLSMVLLFVSVLLVPFVFEYFYCFRRRIVYLLAPLILAAVVLFVLCVPPRGFSIVFVEDVVEFSMFIMCAVWFYVSALRGLSLYYGYGASCAVRREYWFVWFLLGVVCFVSVLICVCLLSMNYVVSMLYMVLLLLAFLVRRAMLGLAGCG